MVVGVAVAERPAAASSTEAAGTPPTPRLVLFSSRSLGDNIVQGIEPTNLDLLMNAVSWLLAAMVILGGRKFVRKYQTLNATAILASPTPVP